MSWEVGEKSRLYQAADSEAEKQPRDTSKRVGYIIHNSQNQEGMNSWIWQIDFRTTLEPET